MSMMAAALQVLQERKVPMTCPELIDVMATEDLWTIHGGKTPASTLYAIISRAIKARRRCFAKTERGKFEAKIMPKEWDRKLTSKQDLGFGVVVAILCYAAML